MVEFLFSYYLPHFPFLIFLRVIIQIKGSDAATTAGTEAAVYAAEATDKNDLLESVLPATVSDYIELVNAHLAAGETLKLQLRIILT